MPESLTPPPALDLDPVDVFAKLVREVNAGLALVELQPRDRRRDAALDALVLARDVLDDARELFASCPHDADPCRSCDEFDSVDVAERRAVLQLVGGGCCE